MALAVNDRCWSKTRVANLLDSRVEAAVSSNGIIERAFPDILGWTSRQN